MEALVNSHISASHDFHCEVPGLLGSAEASREAGLGEVGLGRRAEVSVGGPPSGVTVPDEEPLGIFLMISFGDRGPYYHPIGT